MPGTLFLVATPIGNLEDITYRAVRILGEVELIACEDTRQTRTLLDHFHIRKPLVSYYEHNELVRTKELIERLGGGISVALVSDAGTPTISDPGYRIVKLAVEEGIPVVPIPGASAAMTALAASGLPSDSFHFLGFVPRKTGKRTQILEKIRDLDTTAILYEAPHRVLATLDELGRMVGDRPVVAAREMTKLHEEFLRGSAAEIREALAARAAVKGEFTILIGKSEGRADAAPAPGQLREEVEGLLREGVARMEAIKLVARRHKLPKHSVYKTVEGR